MMTLPKNIRADRSGWRVLLMRYGVTYHSYISYGQDKAAALAQAVAVRDEFYTAAGKTSPRSNTGIVGISETVKWCSGRPYPCFSVSHGIARRRPIRRFVYHTLDQRDRALAAAIAHRQKLEAVYG